MINARNSSPGLTGLMQVATVVRNTYGIRNNFAGLDTDLAINLAGFPSHSIVDGGAQHPWGRVIDVGVDPANIQQFTFTFEDMPEGGCIQIVASTENTAINVAIGGQQIGDYLNANPNAPPILPPSQTCVTAVKRILSGASEDKHVPTTQFLELEL